MSSDVSPLTSIYCRLPWPYLFPLVCLPPPFATAPHCHHPHHHHHHHYHSPPVCLAVTQSAMCVLKTLHNALLSLHSRSKRTIRHRKIAPCWFFYFFFLLSFFFHHHIVLSDFSNRGPYSRPRHYPLQHSSSCWKPNRANGRGVNDQRFQCLKKKKEG